MKNNFELICVIVNHGIGSKVVHIAKQYGVKSGTIMHGTGTANSKILNYLGLSDIRKEFVIMPATSEIATAALEGLNIELKFAKPNHGIAYSLPISGYVSSKNLDFENSNYQTEGANTMYQSIMVIVEKGRAEDVIDAATAAGSKGGTIINARGSGIHETSKVFSMEIEPEKEIVVILSEYDATESIVESIKRNLKLDLPGNGVIFVQPVNKTYGIYK